MAPVSVYSVKINKRFFDLNGKRYVSFTPNPNIKKNAYFYGESLRCDVVSYKRYLFQMGFGDHIVHCKSYLKSAILKFLYNNFEVIDSLDELSSVFQIWILSWQDNIGMESNGIDQFEFSNTYCTEIWGVTKKAIQSKMDKDTVMKGFHWYPLPIECIQDTVVRKIEKQTCRSKANNNFLQGKIEDFSNLFTIGPYNILPTVKDISTILGYSKDVIRSHGIGFFILPNTQKLQILRMLMDEKPNLKQKEIVAEMTNIGLDISLSHLKKIIKDIKEGRC